MGSDPRLLKERATQGSPARHLLIGLSRFLVGKIPYPKLTRLVVYSVTVRDTLGDELRRGYVRRGDYVVLPYFIFRDGRFLV